MANLGMTPEQKQFIDWQQGQYNPTGGGNIGAGNTDPYNDANIKMAQEQLDTAASRVSARAAAGAPPADEYVQPWTLATGSVQQPSASANLGLSSTSSSPAMQGYTPNPYLPQVAKGMQDNSNDNWTRNLQPSIRSGAMAAGSFGGSRQGVVEANGLKDQNNNLANATASLYANDYNTQMGRNLSQYQSDQGYNLGLRSSDLGFSNLDASINQNNTQNQLNYANFGLNTYNTQQAGNNSAANAATTLQNTPYNNWQNFNQQANSSGGAGGTSTSSATAPGNATLGALAGWQIGSQYGKTTS